MDHPPIDMVFLDSATVGEVSNLAAISSLSKYTPYPLTRPTERIERIKEHTIVITNNVVIDRESK
jgi:hypothetical protein